MEEYLNHLRAKGRKAGTIDNNWSVLHRWIAHALAHGQSPMVADPPLLDGFLDEQRDLSAGSRDSYSSHIKWWCEYWERRTLRSPRSTDTRPLRERLESAAEKLLCDVGYLQEIIDLLADKGQVILYGPPGTGKTYLAQELAEALAPDEGTRNLVQFHPAYSYEDFFEGYRPVTDDDRQMTYELTQGPLANLAEHAAEYPEQQHVMVIDEINRANLPRVLGELLFLLEYRDKSIAVMHRPDGNFNLPKNLWFIGTMNTADRSIALIDAAMRRRFHFVPFFPEREPTKSLLRKWTNKNAPGQAWVVDIVSAVNSELNKELGGEHLQLGPSHFMKTNLNEGGFKRVWEYNIEPFIEDQLFGNPNKIKKFRLDAVLLRYGPEHFEGSDLLDGPAIPEDELPSSSGQASSGGRAAVSPEMRNTPLVRGLEERLGDRLRFHPAHAPAGFLLADTDSPEGFSLRTLHSNQNVSLLNVTAGTPTVYFPPRASLDKLANKRSEIEAYANALMSLGLDIGQFGPRKKPKLP
ncbi:MAG: AAA family ATPase, partial [Acidimicrobiaceae bacterium]|nr:AAA family ATPase [Acidimicrobiaceae bacterium]